MKFNIFADNTLIGWSDLPSGDPPMGVASGRFYPNEAYEKIRPLIRERELYDGLFDGVKDEQLLNEAWARINAIHFSVFSEEGQELHPEAGILLSDFSEELGEDGYEVSVMGLPYEEYARYFQEQIIQSENQFNGNVPQGH